MDVGIPGYLLMAVEHSKEGGSVACVPTTSCHQAVAGAPGGSETTRARVGGVGHRVRLGLERGDQGEVRALSWLSRAWGNQGP